MPSSSAGARSSLVILAICAASPRCSGQPQPFWAAFSRLGHILLAPLSYFTITMIPNNAVSPFASGSSLS
jgi:hypothetical protein